MPNSAEFSIADLTRIVTRLGEPHRYPHPAGEVTLVETHISWVLLAGEFAYKLKKPVNLGFVNFSTGKLRHAACREEIRLNARLAPAIYLDVVSVTGTIDNPRIGGDGPVLDHAVRMRRFDRSLELDRLLAADRLDVGVVDELAETVARFHAAIPVAGADDGYGTPATVLALTLGNFEQVTALEHEPRTAGRIEALAHWTRSTHERIAVSLAARLADGHVRECHGDLHLANIVLHDRRVTVFDCIEFNPALRWIDVMAEVAFTVMDLAHRGRADLGRRFLQVYLESTGDYAGLAVLRFYLVYRAMVRAKVAAIRAAQESDPGARARDEADFLAHLDLAEAFAAAPPPALLITFGPSGSGKSFAAERLAMTADWIRIRSDVERKRLAGLSALARTRSAPGGGLYDSAMSERTYARLAGLARSVVGAGYPVIVDATFLGRERRGEFRAIARELGVPFAILAPAAPASTLRQRLRTREAAGNDASEATTEVLERQLGAITPLDAGEEAVTVHVDENLARNPSSLAAAVKASLRR